MYDAFMGCPWKRWIALLLLVFSATTSAANVCSVLSAAHTPGSATMVDCQHEGSAPAAADGTQTEFCALAATPALSHSAPSLVSPGAAYVPPLTTAVAKGLDPQPPLKPPPT